MQDEKNLSRDVTGTIVPYGDKVVIPAQTRVMITHRLGGNFTVTWEGGMAQIMGRDADALGEEVTAAAKVESAAGDHTGPPSEDAVWGALKQVYDPEIPVNIVDLGLVYTMDIVEADGRHEVRVDMTLTAPGCGMGPAIAQDAKYKVEQVPGVANAEVSIVWDPPWNQEMISEDGKMELGLI